MSKEDVSVVLHISSDSVGGACTECKAGFGIQDGSRTFEERVNHYLKKHSYKLLHVGQQTDMDRDGKPYQMTIAVLGR